VRFFKPDIPNEFYDHLNDPQEATNLHPSTDPPVQAALRDLDARLRHHLTATHDRALLKSFEL